MNADPTPPVSDPDLHAWVDGQLPPGRAEAVAEWLLSHPEEARRVQAWQSQRLGLQALHRGVLEEPVPLALARATRPQRWRGMAQALVASVLLAIGFAGGSWWQSPDRSPAPMAQALPGFVQEARVAHVVYLPEKRHPVEVGAAEQAHLVQWLSRRLGAPLKAPLLQAQGFSLVGGRLLPGQQGEARAMFMYENTAGERITLHVSALNAAAAPEAAAFRFTRSGETETFYWIDQHLGYALSGNLPRETLAVLADASYQQLRP
ncbi:MAG: anti-sigma factor [Hydrogenophaga sp.]|uniref:anti-sigma factor family protein n=1 Tax=Hydrogenophaga sp. TaxID=1904254 RepID=UPI0025C358A8|nr:anti-sigma factor [Hydrogenophaga sp.]MBT9552070.1 anti-sigma factor [Hydrogenophaga sp.]